jgi:hypothetical protein
MVERMKEEIVVDYYLKSENKDRFPINDTIGERIEIGSTLCLSDGKHKVTDKIFEYNNYDNLEITYIIEYVG